jgi:hypothetical protein
MTYFFIDYCFTGQSERGKHGEDRFDIDERLISSKLLCLVDVLEEQRLVGLSEIPHDVNVCWSLQL